MYQPKLIKTEAENEQALVLIEQLMNLPNRSPEQEAIYELLIILVEKFEQEFYQPIQESNPGSMLSFLMDQRDLQPIDLAEIFGSEGAVENVMNGKVCIDRVTGDRLADLFHVDSILFSS